MRFQDINVSSTDTIVSAELEFTVDDDDLDSGTTNVTIYGEYTETRSHFQAQIKLVLVLKQLLLLIGHLVLGRQRVTKHVSPDISGNNPRDCWSFWLERTK